MYFHQVRASPDGCNVASAAGDETIRIWKVWPEKEVGKGKAGAASKAKRNAFKETGLNKQRVIR